MPGTACRRALGDAGWRTGAQQGQGTAECPLQQGSGWAGFLPVQDRLSRCDACALPCVTSHHLLFSGACALLGSSRSSLPAQGAELRCTEAVAALPLVCLCRQPLTCGQRNGPWQARNVSRLHAVQLRCSHSFVCLVLGQGILLITISFLPIHSSVLDT